MGCGVSASALHGLEKQLALEQQHRKTAEKLLIDTRNTSSHSKSSVDEMLIQLAAWQNTVRNLEEHVMNDTQGAILRGQLTSAKMEVAKTSKLVEQLQFQIEDLEDKLASRIRNEEQTTDLVLGLQRHIRLLEERVSTRPRSGSVSAPVLPADVAGSVAPSNTLQPGSLAPVPQASSKTDAGADLSRLPPGTSGAPAIAVEEPTHTQKALEPARPVTETTNGTPIQDTPANFDTPIAESSPATRKPSAASKKGFAALLAAKKTGELEQVVATMPDDVDGTPAAGDLSISEIANEDAPAPSAVSLPQVHQQEEMEQVADDAPSTKLSTGQDSSPSPTEALSPVGDGLTPLPTTETSASDAPLTEAPTPHAPAPAEQVVRKPSAASKKGFAALLSAKKTGELEQVVAAMPDNVDGAPTEGDPTQEQSVATDQPKSEADEVAEEQATAPQQPEPTAELVSPPVDESAPRPQPQVEEEEKAKGEEAPAPESEPAEAPEPEAQPQPEPEPAGGPEPAPEQVSQPAQEVEPEEPAPEQVSPPQPGPEPIQEPGPVKEPEPSEPEPVQEPGPVSTPEPVPAPEPVQETGPASAPEPVPAPELVQETGPASAPWQEPTEVHAPGAEQGSPEATAATVAAEDDKPRAADPDDTVEGDKPRLPDPDAVASEMQSSFEAAPAPDAAVGSGRVVLPEVPDFD